MTADLHRRTTELIAALQTAGWRIRRNRRNGNVVAYPPDPTCEPVSIHRSWSDRRSYANTLSHLRRSGWNDHP